MPNQIKWVKGNSKLKITTGAAGSDLKVIGFGIPADTNFTIKDETFNTCPAARDCRGVCYAKAARFHNLEMTMRSDFVDIVVKELKSQRSYNAVRIHDSGDFYNQEYYDKWCEIARQLPNHTFYAYTKSLHLSLFGNKPSNLKIVQSLGGKMDNFVKLSLPHSRIFATDQDRINAGYENGSESDAPAIHGTVKLGLVYHGNKKLTESQKIYFK
jgi:hypothetical protein